MLAKPSFLSLTQCRRRLRTGVGRRLAFQGKEPERAWLVPGHRSGRSQHEGLHLPVNLPLRSNGNQTLGPGFGETVKSSLAHPHEMNFLLSRSDYDRISDLVGNVLRSYQTKDPDKALSDYTNAVDRAKKGSLRVAISSYKTDPKTGALTRINFVCKSPLPWTSSLLLN